MSMQDPIADMFVRIKNAMAISKPLVAMPLSKVKRAIAQVLKQEGYIEDFEVNKHPGGKNQLVVALKYHQGKSVIDVLKRVSTPGRRVYKGVEDIPLIQNGLGVCIVSTSKGVMTDRQARAQKLGGEVIGEVC